MAARNEDWCIGLTARAALMWLDELVVLNHASTDSTGLILSAIAAEYPGRVTVLIESDPVWQEMRHRQMMLAVARRRNATHICYIDADEILTGDLLDDTKPGVRCVIRGLFASMPDNLLLQIPWLALRGSIGQVHTSGPWADGQVASFGFMDDPKLGWSSVGRGGYDFHHRHPMGKLLIPWTPITNRCSGLLHLQYLSGRRLRAKQAKYKCDEILRWPGREPDQIRAVNQRYNLAVYGCVEPTEGWSERLALSLGEAPIDQWWRPYQPLMKHLHIQAEPWQEAEVKRLVADHGDKLKGLDLFGLAENLV